MNSMCAAIQEFFAMSVDDKKKYEAKTASDPIQWSNFQQASLWRDYLTLYVHPEFHCPDEPQSLREVVSEYTKRMRQLARKLVEAVAESLELEKQDVDQLLLMDSSFQMLTSNLYPPCPEPDRAIGLPPHTDPGLFTLLIHNGVAGLQIQRDGEWLAVDSPPSSILVNVADQLEIFSNGKCKSVMHRAVVNGEKQRISIVAANGPSKAATVGPAAALVENDGRALYKSMNYGEYLAERFKGSRVDGKTLLERMAIRHHE
ncbi:2-oxoglutarate-dependent dioxygenase 19-like isoform X2 [Andrographis paniculata]|nr:2-oxoglutarate-dependent dioxygenase 19-like isoform X2 [Andrographis paniculata]